MTRPSRKSMPDDVAEFIATEQELFIRYLEVTYQQKKITESYYMFALSQSCEETNWDGAIDYFHEAFKGFVDQHERYEYYRLLERIEKGEEYLAKLPPESPEYAKGEKLLERLCEELRKHSTD